MSIPNWELVPNRGLREHSRIAFPIIVLPEDDLKFRSTGTIDSTRDQARTHIFLVERFTFQSCALCMGQGVSG